MRKRRCDRNHIVYQLRVHTQIYIGVTYVEKDVTRSLRRRWQKHVRRALTENRDWKLCKAIRRFGPEKFEISVIEIVRGKSEAHNLERVLIRTLNPKLNSDIR